MVQGLHGGGGETTRACCGKYEPPGAVSSLPVMRSRAVCKGRGEMVLWKKRDLGHKTFLTMYKDIVPILIYVPPIKSCCAELLITVMLSRLISD